MFYSYFYSLLRAGYVIIPVQSVSDFVDFCNAAGRYKYNISGYPSVLRYVETMPEGCGRCRQKRRKVSR